MIPPRPSLRRLAASPRIGMTAQLLQQPNADTPEYPDLVRAVVGLVSGTFRAEGDLDPRPVPGQGADVQVWVLGSSDGPSAAIAGELALRFAANYHVSPATVLEAVDAYRAAFVPSAELERPYVAVSADVVVGPDDETAHRLATGYAPMGAQHPQRRGGHSFPHP